MNDLLIEHQGERAQIDHLVIHPFGFILIESKSIVGEAKVNAEGEWSRSYRGNWIGMPSPIRQAELQQKLLRSLLGANVERFLGKLLGIQTQVVHREWNVLCAVTSTVILHRDKMPKDVASKIVKTEFLAEKARETIGGTAGAIFKAKANFSMRELKNIGRFLLDHAEQLRHERSLLDSIASSGENSKIAEPALQSYTVIPDVSVAAFERSSTVATIEKTPLDAASNEHFITCNQCGETEQLVGMYGQYGYYVKCKSCGTNTSMKQPCMACGWKRVRITKDGSAYIASCQKRDHQYLVFKQRE
nr:nuclease-related domain-containing protein [uncultured Halomonas sp.]